MIGEVKYVQEVKYTNNLEKGIFTYLTVKLSFKHLEVPPKDVKNVKERLKCYSTIHFLEKSPTHINMHDSAQKTTICHKS